MRSVRIALVGALLLGGLVGCRNRVAEENREMWDQNRKLQEELDRRNAELEAARRAEELRASTPAPAPAPAPTAPAPTPAPPPTPLAVPTPAPAPITEIGGQEAFEDRAAGTVTVNLPGDIFFDPGAATIKQPARAALEKVAAALQKQYPGKQVRIEGHTDTDPIRKSKWKSNQELSEARARAVRDYLVSKGIPADRITTEGFGADKPRGQDKARNRRVEVVVLVDANAPNAPRGQGGGRVETDEQNK